MIEKLEEFKASPVLGHEKTYEVRELALEDAIKKINEIIDKLNESEVN